MSRLNWTQRQSPTDEDRIAPEEVSYEFDYTRCVEPGQPSWPKKHQGQRFGPSLIKQAWRKGLVVVAEINGLPYPVAVLEARWLRGVLEVGTTGNWYIPERIWTRKTVKGLTSCGELIE